MDLQGSIEKFTLSEIFQLIATGRKSGTLGIQRDDSIVMIYFQAGEIVYGYGPRQTFHLGKLLTDLGRLTSEQLQKAINIQADTGNNKRLGAILIDQGYIDRADLQTVIRRQVEELLYSLLAWQSGSFKFYEDQFPTEEEITVNLSVENVILEGLRRIDERTLVAETLPDPTAIFAIATSAQGRTRALTMKASEWNVMALVDGHKTVEQICQASSFEKHETLKRMAQLKLAGLIEISKRKPQTQAASNNLEQMIGSLTRQLENYLTEKAESRPVDQPTNRLVTGEIVSESN